MTPLLLLVVFFFCAVLVGATPACEYQNTYPDDMLYSGYTVADVWQVRPTTFTIPPICPVYPDSWTLSKADVWDTIIRDMTIAEISYNAELKSGAVAQSMSFQIANVACTADAEFIISTPLFFDVHGTVNVIIRDMSINIKTEIPNSSTPRDRAQLKHTCTIPILSVTYDTTGKDISSKLALTALDGAINSAINDLDALALSLCDSVPTDLLEFLGLRDDIGSSNHFATALGSLLGTAVKNALHKYNDGYLKILHGVRVKMEQGVANASTSEI